MLIGPFFYIHGKLICHTCPPAEGRRQADKLDDSYGHEQLWDDHFSTGDYIDYPRGRVMWDCARSRAVIYIDRCINTPEVLAIIQKAFDLQDYVIASDDHYRCRNCVGDAFAEE